MISSAAVVLLVDGHLSSDKDELNSGSVGQAIED